MALPDGEVVLERLRTILADTSRRTPTSVDDAAAGWGAAPSSSASERAVPAVVVVAVDGHDRLVDVDEGAAEEAMAEIGRRLDRLVRSGDVLGRLGPDRFVLVAPALSTRATGSLIERMSGAAAMPVELDGQPVSIGVTVGTAFADSGLDAVGLLHAAQADVERIRSRRDR